jgi:hypothetical protein
MVSGHNGLAALRPTRRIIAGAAAEKDLIWIPFSPLKVLTLAVIRATAARGKHRSGTTNRGKK